MTFGIGVVGLVITADYYRHPHDSRLFSGRYYDLITVPVFMPLIQQYGIDPLHFGVIITLCTMVALLTPPVGMSLYAVVSISGVPIGQLSKEIWPYLAAIVGVILLVTFFPEFSLWLPHLLMG